jgi:hypothetical protein
MIAAWGRREAAVDGDARVLLGSHGGGLLGPHKAVYTSAYAEQMRSNYCRCLSVGAATPLGTLEMGVLATTGTIQHAIAVNALLGLLLLRPAVALTPLVWQRVPHLNGDGT